MPSSLFHRILISAASVAVLAAAGGCAMKNAGPKTGFYVVTSPTAEFFKYGPAQSFGPDLMLKKGERVTMLERAWGFSKVLTHNGIAGYVASEDVEPAPASASSSRIASSQRGATLPIGGVGGMSSSRQNRIRSEVLGDPSDPLFNVNDVPLPLPDDVPPSGERPQFRTTRQTPGEAQPAQKPKFR